MFVAFVMQSCSQGMYTNNSEGQSNSGAGYSVGNRAVSSAPAENAGATTMVVTDSMEDVTPANVPLTIDLQAE